MTMRTIFFLLLSSFFAVLSAPAETLTYPDLVERMIDLKQLSKLPPEGEKTSLASSYDRKSQYDAANDKYIDWSANQDGSGLVRHEGDKSVLAEITGPGCIWRTWSATANDGHVKIYLDGAETPAVDLPFKGYFDGKTAPFNRPNIVYIPSPDAHGFDNYTPMPFQKSCKIVADAGWGQFYQFTYTQFPPGTVVPTFKMDLSPADSAALDHANQILGQCGQNPTDPQPDTKTESKDVTVDTGKTSTVADLTGTGAITALKVKLDLPKDRETQRVLLRQLTVSITWDDDKEPSVWSPLGDFFGFVGGAMNYQSLPLGLMEDGTFYSYWYMPYARKAHIEVGNDSSDTVSMKWEITHTSLDSVSGLARFHAKWHRDIPLERADRDLDWTLLKTQGQGRYVGTHLHVWNPRSSWWGEGDDKFFVDGEKFPSTFGTGSEDYFGYAWSSGATFSRPYHNQLLSEWNGHIDDNRWHISDSVPFQKSYEASIEKYFGNNRPTLYATEVFWYLASGGTDPYGALPITDRIGYWVRPEMYLEANVIEGENLHAATKPIEKISSQNMEGFGKKWSNNHQLFWPAFQVGQTLELDIPAPKAGKYKLKAHFTSGPDFGIFQMAFDDTNLGAPIDFYAPAVSINDPVDLGPVVVTDGKHILKITVTGKNDASKGTAFGLDYLKFVPTP